MMRNCASHCVSLASVAFALQGKVMTHPDLGEVFRSLRRQVVFMPRKCVLGCIYFWIHVLPPPPSVAPFVIPFLSVFVRVSARLRSVSLWRCECCDVLTWHCASALFHALFFFSWLGFLVGSRACPRSFEVMDNLVEMAIKVTGRLKTEPFYNVSHDSHLFTHKHCFIFPTGARGSDLVLFPNGPHVPPPSLSVCLCLSLCLSVSLSLCLSLPPLSFVLPISVFGCAAAASWRDACRGLWV